MSPSILFWDVDTQTDFICPGGKLYIAGAEDIVFNLKRLTDCAARNGILVIASVCAHQPDDREFDLYPPHCLVGTCGQQKIPETQLPNALVLPNRSVPLPRDLLHYQQLILEKQKLDVFSNPNTERVLEQLKSVRDIILYGVATETCVARAWNGLARRQYRLRLITDATRYLDKTEADLFLKQVGTASGMLVTTQEIIAEFSSPRTL